MSDRALLSALSNLSPEKRALLADMLRPAPEPIAIIGLACRFPGGANTPEQFWRNLAAGQDAVTEVPTDRWPAAHSAMRYGAFLDRIDQFDAGFFGIAPREAARMDPQQRLFLEVAWEALENAGQTLEGLAGSATGVYAAVYQGDYASLQLAEAGSIDAHVASGMSHAILANRLSHFLDAHGPSLAIDTACSSSLVALHLAVRSLRAKETDLALAGGVNLIISPLTGLAVARWGALAADGRIKAFDAAADGFVRGEGCGVLVLKRLADARRAGDPILAVVRGSAVNQDGRTNVLTAPNGLAQKQVLEEALRDAGLRPEQVGYVEAHGTGTPLGDPIELEALSAVYDPHPHGAAGAAPLWIGSVKTNIGHLEAAAGAAGIIKAVLALRHALIPPHLHFHTLNPHITLGDTRLAIAAQAQPWPATDTPRRAAVSSFGFGGTNAHLLLEEAPAVEPAGPVNEGSTERPLLLTLSAPQPSALPALASAYRAALAQWQAEGTPLAAICATAARRRTHFNHRLAVVGRNHAELSSALEAYVAGQPHPALAVGRRAGGTTVGPVFVFSGQGVQWAGMGRDLYELYPVFRAALDACEAAFHPHLGCSLIAAINDEEFAGEAALSLADTALVQPAIFAVQVALAALWQSLGVQPAAVVGHSLGEVSAAYVAGALTLADAVQVVIARSRLMQTITGLGAMAAVGAPPEALLPRLRRFAGLAVAAVNAPASTVVAGDPSELAEFLTEVETTGARVQKLPVNYAFHSPQVWPLVAPLLRQLAGLRPQAGRVSFVSTVTGQRLAGERLDAAYWGQNLSEPVLFARAVEGLVASGFSTFLEVSPHPALSQYVKEGLEQAGTQGVVAHSLRKGRDEALTLTANLGQLYAHGVGPDWEAVLGPAVPPVALPNYPWQHRRYWFEAGPAPAARPAPSEPAPHPLLERRVHSPFVQGALFESVVTANHPPYQGDHRIHDVLVVPATTYLEMLSAAGRLLFGPGAHAVQDLTIRDALIVPTEGHVTLQLHVATVENGQPAEFQIAAAGPEAPDEWQTYAKGKLTAAVSAVPNGAAFVPDAVQARCNETVEGEAYYQLGRQYGGALGQRFRSIRQLWRGPGESLGRLELAPQLQAEAEGCTIHPAYMDAVFHIAYAAQPGELAAAGILMPVSFERVVYHYPAPPAGWCHFRLRSGEADSLVVGDAWLYDDAGALVAEARGIRYLRATGRDVLLRHTRAAARDVLYRLQWQPAPLTWPAPEPAAGTVLILSDEQGYGRVLAEALTGRGLNVALAFRGTKFEASGSAFRLDPDDAGHYQRLLQAVAPPARLRVIDLWPVEAASRDQAFGAPRFDRSALLLAQAAISHTGAAVPKLWFVTRRAQPAGQADLDPTGALLWGFGRTLALEHPAVFGGLIDLGDHSPDAAAVLLAPEWLQPEGETQLAYRSEGRLAVRLVRQAEPASSAEAETEPHFAAEGTYLVSGATGGIGRHLARWLVDHGARHLLLLSRSAGPAADEFVDSLRARGASVYHDAVDVADAAALAAALEAASASLPPLQGVFHAAGVVADAALLQLSPQRMEEVLAAKVGGAWNLHTLTAGLPLRHFVLFSSAAAVLGSPGQGNYAAANAGLDALAHLRRAAGLPALSINWGPWQVGMAAAVGEKGRQRWETWGLDPLAPEKGLGVLARLLRQAAPQVAVLPMAWPPRTERALAHVQRQPLFRELTQRLPQPPSALARPQPPRLRQELAALPARRQKQALVDYLRAQVAGILGWDASFEIDPRQGLFDLGLDSLTAVELRERLDAALDLPQPLPATVAFDYPTLEALAGHLLDKLALAATSVEAAAPPAATDHLDDLSEDELAAMLADELRAIEKEK